MKLVKFLIILLAVLWKCIFDANLWYTALQNRNPQAFKSVTCTQFYEIPISDNLHSSESKLLQQPQSTSRDIPPTPAGFTPILATPTSQLGYPPIITHTAATPQGSPHSTLEPSGRGDLNNRLSPAMALYCTTDDRPQVNRNSWGTDRQQDCFPSSSASAPTMKCLASQTDPDYYGLYLSYWIRFHSYSHLLNMKE